MNLSVYVRQTGVPGNMNGVPFQILATSMIRYNMVSRMKAKQAVTMINDTDLKKYI